MYFFGNILGLAVFVAIVAHMYRRFRPSMTNFPSRLAFGISLCGLLGFFEPLWINWFPPDLLSGLELPNDPFQGVRLTAPDGRVFIVSPAIARVQRYGPEGFEKGFTYGHKAFQFEMSASGNILVCDGGGVGLTYSPDGEELPPPGSCQDRLDASSSFYQSHAKVPAIAFNWFSATAFPFWHPVAGWFLMLVGGIFFEVSSSSKPDTP